MKPKSIVNLGLAFVLLPGVLAWLGPVQPARAAGIWYVAPGGNDAANCTTPGTSCGTINGALGKAVAGDTILVAAGLFTDPFNEYDVVSITKSISISGGWNPAFSEQNSFSVLDGQNTRAVLFLGPGWETVVTMDRFIIQNGYAYSEGGGVYNKAAFTLTNSIITHNTAEISGGGILNSGDGQGRLTIKNSVISDNTVLQRFGGGIENGSFLFISNSTISNNSAPEAGGGSITERMN